MSCNDEPKYFVIAEQSEYHIKLDEVKNLEECTGEFFTEEEIREVCGLSKDHYLHTYNYAHVMDNKVIAYLASLKAQMLKAGKKTIIIDDEEFIECVSKNGIAVSDYVTGLRRTGNRLSLYEKKERDTPNLKDVQSLISFGTRAISKKYGMSPPPTKKGDHQYHFDVDIKYAHFNYGGAIDIIQKLVTLEEVINSIDPRYVPESSKYFNMIWDNPSLYAVKK